MLNTSIHFFDQSVWGWGQSPFGFGGVCQTWIATTLQCATRERGWVFTLHFMFVFFFPTLTAVTFLFTPVSLLSGEFVAQFKFTVLLMANGPHRITNGPFDPEFYKSEHEVQDPELKVKIVNSLDLHEAPFVTQKLAALYFIHFELKLFPRLYYKALQAVKHRRKRKRR